MFRTGLLARTSAAASLARTQQRRSLACGCLYVRGLPLDMTKDRLKSLFEEYGPIYDTHMMTNRPGDRFSIGFVRYYDGELPATVEKVAMLPPPPTEEIERVRGFCQNAIDAWAGRTLDNYIVDAQYSSRNNPDHIQFQARMQMRRESDPEWASQRQSRTAQGNNRSGGESGGSYSDGYKNGFRDGMAEAKRA
ncbi:hypothetical protein IWQ56_002759 [Coemansia nantahalensis]|uniref:Uncharacterized protein n=1 Tax=Coemansia helicoidea TaxID=1286919 RepID=A0ACC1L243_9FUNG|nr:hypothetical protein IWQ56_002759 [Coemansia nantahalensis]KAJ2799513.1 hypothetical protein H4R21_003519 [Coemansia helicoidea]